MNKRTKPLVQIITSPDSELLVDEVQVIVESTSQQIYRQTRKIISAKDSTQHRMELVHQIRKCCDAILKDWGTC